MKETTFNGLLSAITQARGTDNFIPNKVYMHSQFYENMKNKVQQLYWPRAMGKTNAIKTFMGMDIATNDSLSVNQMVMMDKDGNVKMIIGEQDMCMDCREGARVPSYEEQRMGERLQNLEKNHLGAQTERFIAMARELGQNDHLREVVREAGEQLSNTTYDLSRTQQELEQTKQKVVKVTNSRASWAASYNSLEHRYNAYKKKNAPKKKPATATAAKAAKKK